VAHPVIVNSANSVESLTKKSLAACTVALIDYRGDLDRVASFYKASTGLSDVRLRTSWMGMVFRGELQELPMNVKTEAEMIAYVAATPNAIGFVDAELLRDQLEGIKIVKLDGATYRLDVAAEIDSQMVTMHATITVPQLGFHIASISHDSLSYRPKGQVTRRPYIAV
jgi:ABC-type phosphate transport system substrate-binding protein